MTGPGEKGVSVAQSSGPWGTALYFHFFRLALHFINLSVILNKISVCVGQTISSILYELFGKLERQ
jgi:hypothetical protein